MNFGQFMGVLLGAAIGNKFEMRKLTALCMLSHALGLLALTYASDMAGLIAFAALHGLAWGLRGPFMSAIRADYFGRHAIGVILGLSAAIAAVGQVAGPLVAGVLADLTGDYRLGFTLLAILSAMGSLAFILATRPVQEEAGQTPVS
jgi:MFS family permease